MTEYKVTLRPSNQVIMVNSEKNLLEALRENDVYVKSSCGGVASCSDCICKIVTGEDNLESPPFAELKLLGNVFHITKERLLCQTKIVGDVTIDITKHDKVTDQEKLKSKTNRYTPKKTPTKVRSSEEFKKIKDERYLARTENLVKDQAWEKHWEKNTDGSVKKPLGGGKRPKFFDTDKAIELTKKELADRDYKREKFKNIEERNARMSEREKSSFSQPIEKTRINQEVESINEVEADIDLNSEGKDFKKFRRE